MSSQTFGCPWVLGSDGWQKNVVMSVSSAGIIESVNGDADEHTHVLPGVVIPGMPNVHSHAHQRLIAGLTGRRGVGEDSFWSWREQMYRALGLLTAEDLEILATWLYCELMEGGYTVTGEFHYPHRLADCDPVETSRALLNAAGRAGCGLTLLPVWYRYSGFGRKSPTAEQERFILGRHAFGELIEQLGRHIDPDGLHGLGMAPHSLRAVDVADLAELVDDIRNVPVHVHISEQPAEVEACLAATGKRPIELLADHVDLDGRWCLIHATHASDDELAIMADSEAVVGLCPTTEADLGDGIFPADRLLDMGGRWAIGSDSNLVTNAPAELQLLEWAARLSRNQRNVLVGEQGGHIGTRLWSLAAASGARALAQPVGELAPGRRADFIVLSEQHPLLYGLAPDQQLDTLVTTGRSDLVDEVHVAGQCMVRNGKHRLKDSLSGEFTRLRARLAQHGASS
jgi:formimidoylglutamate deiminase